MTTGFLNRLKATEEADGKHSTVDEPLVYKSEMLGGRLIIVPIGFKFDFASHPLRTARGPYNRAACLHDWLYAQQPHGFSRKLADDIFYEAMRSCGVNAIQAYAFFCAVRLGGWKAWRKHAKRNRLSDVVRPA